MHSKPSDEPEVASTVAQRRREEIVVATAAIIAEIGLHQLSLARIEERLQMSRGQLTYYFPTKEAILLAVFDQLLQELIQRTTAVATDAGFSVASHDARQPGIALPLIEFHLNQLLNQDVPSPEQQKISALVHTFFAQIGHRADYRDRLAEANRAWRDCLTANIESSLPEGSTVNPAALSSILMAMFSGLGDQVMIDRNAVPRADVLKLCLEMVRPYFGETK